MSMTAPRRKCGRWTNAEDEILIHKVRAQELIGQPRDWSSIAAIIIGRSNKDCRKRWLRLNGCIKKGEWSSSEDKQLCDAVQQFGSKWVEVSKYLKTRSADQCAARWQNYLNPNIKRHKWSDDEDQRLLYAFRVYGSNWKTIQMHELTDRSLQDIRNRYKSLSRLFSRNSMSPFIFSTTHPDAINQIHDRSPMPPYDMFSLDGPQYTPIDGTMLLNTVPPAPIDYARPPINYTGSESEETLFHENIHGFSRLWSHLDVTADFRSPIESNNQQIHIDQPVAHWVDGTYIYEEMDIKATTSETNGVVTFEGFNKHALDQVWAANTS
ncbi:uncharacterized protein TRIVIDRAFT_67833 [Trichoderma virens Gv29-8]|uniref:Myb transcription factor n=1 Tax=Hypocrea virens (strain Gv29-8 / FGSC 10586) TaxID=413071 RepID=G9N0X8_HYPVG|nr:uncharacterized protein TRIVIDRAFT_67833 [Trichoderma virens Gv29-8]EHK19411.1 hypothetical protein TRIVIDRAFT_67833 [Trichoderma virens Gv29-8]UKZ58331.1 hypothetical protein TrVGV298_012199 [Trichoderma virens]